MRRLIVIVLFISLLATLWARPAAAQPGLGSHDLVAAGSVGTVKTDGLLAAWTTNNENLFVADVTTGQVTSLDSKMPIARGSHLAVSSGRVAWTRSGLDTEIRIYTAATGATTTQPIVKQLESFDLHGNLLVWIEHEGWPENPRQTGWMRNLQTMAPATQIFSRASTLYGGEHVRTNGNVAVWAQAVSIELRGARCYELYKVGLSGSSTPVRLGAGPCSTAINDFALEPLVVWYRDAGGTLYRHQLLDAVDAFSDSIFDGATDLQVSGYYLAGRQYVIGPQGSQDRQMWLYDTRSKSKWTVALPVSTTNDNDLSIAIGGHTVVWSEKIGGEWLIKIRPISEVTPAAPRAASDPLVQGRTYFAASQHSLGGRFEQYWGKNGGLPVFGLPLTEEFRQQNPDTRMTYAVQYLERQRYEYHPELAGTAYEILLGRLGAELLESQGRNWRNEGADQPGVQQLPGTCQTFATTNRTVCGAFLEYWRGHGLDLGQAGITADESLALFGYPLTEPRLETNPDGDQVLTQWFERARFEWHPNNPAPYQVLLGRLAAEQLPKFEW